MLRRYSSRTLSNIIESAKRFNRNRFDGYYQRSRRLSHTVTLDSKISMSVKYMEYTEVDTFCQNSVLCW